MQSTVRKIILSCIGLFLLEIAPVGMAKIDLSITHDTPKQPYVAFNIEGKEALQLWKYLLQLQKNGVEIKEEAGMNKHYLQSSVFYFYRTNSEVYEPKKSDDDPELYYCSLQMNDKGLAVQH